MGPRGSTSRGLAVTAQSPAWRCGHEIADTTTSAAQLSSSQRTKGLQGRDTAIPTETPTLLRYRIQGWVGQQPGKGSGGGKQVPPHSLSGEHRHHPPFPLLPPTKLYIDHHCFRNHQAPTCGRVGYWILLSFRSPLQHKESKQENAPQGSGLRVAAWEGDGRTLTPPTLVAHLTPPMLSSSTSSLMVMEGDVLVKSIEGSMRRRSRGCSRCSRSRSRRRTKNRRARAVESSRNTCKQHNPPSICQPNHRGHSTQQQGHHPHPHHQRAKTGCAGNQPMYTSSTGAGSGG